ncbi:phytoene desaturase family protein [Streptomyces lydicus]|nr:phytoene desaturase family protein [Streptomyces lydicus]
MRTVKGPTDHVVVVGAGLSGLSATLHLLGAGRRVTVVEREALPGGRAGRIESHGYRIDTGPTVLTMPDLIDEAFAAVGERLTDRMELRALHPAYRARFADGSELDVHTDPQAMEAEVERFAGPAAAHGYRRLRHWLQQLYARPAAPLHRRQLRLTTAAAAPDLIRLAVLGGFGRLDDRIGRFLPDPRLRRVFSFQALYAGVPPARALAAYAVIAYMDTVGGVYFPRGGMHALPRAMADAAADAGAAFRYGHPVTRLERGGDRITAVVTAHERIPCDAVVLTPDLPLVHRLLGRRPAARSACVTRPPRWSCTPAPTGPGRGWHTTRSPSAPRGSGPSTNSPAPAG